MNASSIFRDPIRGVFQGAACLLAMVSCFGAARCARGLDPDRRPSQYIHDLWNSQNGFPGGQVTSIAQTGEGYLWVGTDRGLVRFDGTHFLTIHDLGRSLLPTSQILGLTTDDQGDLWIRVQGPDLLRYRAGRFSKVPLLSNTPEVGITAMSSGSAGEILFSTVVSGSLRYAKGKLENIIPPDVLRGSLKISIARTTDGRIWLGTRDEGLFYLQNGKPVSVLEGLPDRKINCLLPIGDGRLWIGTDSGVALWDGARITQSAVPPDLLHVQALTLSGDRDANIWIGTSRGLLRLNSNVRSVPEDRDLQVQGEVNALFEDREGDLWIGDAQGLERVRDSPFVTYSAANGVSTRSDGPIYVDADGRTWFAPLAGGLYWAKDGLATRVTAAGLGEDVVYSITGGQDGVWVGRQKGGLTHLVIRGTTVAASTLRESDGLAQNSVFTVRETKDGTLWAGTLSGGVNKLKNGRITTYNQASGLSSNNIASIEEGSDGSMWFATSNGLSRLLDGRWSRFGQTDGLPLVDVLSLFDDSQGVLWIGTNGGLVYLIGDRIHRVDELQEWLGESILGIQDDHVGDLWIATSERIFEVRRSALLQNRIAEGDLRQFGAADGLSGSMGVRRDRSVVADTGGHIWFSTNRGISSVNPARANALTVPPLAQVDAVIADGTPISLHGPVRISSSHQRITIRYQGLSLAVPDQVRFRYRLDGFDQDWSEPVSTQEAIYTNLGPGIYSFHVVASDGNGFWNGSQAVLPLTIVPQFWQTWWFQIPAWLALLSTVWLVYRLRLQQATAQARERLSAQMAERERIARELHDTILQGFYGIILRFQTAADQVPEHDPARKILEDTLDRAESLLNQGRETIRGLRGESSVLAELSEEFARISEDYQSTSSASFSVAVEGSPRAIHPVVRDEVYHIGHEAIVNAFQHSQASHIEVVLTFDTSWFLLRIQDDGQGVDDAIVEAGGRVGHWGMIGMRERAHKIGGQFSIWSRPGAGTEIQLNVPAKLAYQETSRPRRRFWQSRSVETGE